MSGRPVQTSSDGSAGSRPERPRRRSRLGWGILIGAAGIIVIAAVAGFAVVELGLVPANADAKPTGLERWAAMTSLHATLRRDAPTGGAPAAPDAATLIGGIHVYADHCLVCHGGPDGSPSDIARGLYQTPPQLAREGVEDDPVGYTEWKVTHGIRWTGMPAFGATLGEQEIRQVSLFLKHMNDLPPAAKKAWAETTAPAAPAAGSGGT